MERQKNDNAAITERFRNLTCPEEKKQVLNDYLMAILAEGRSFLLKRNRVMIIEQNNKTASFVHLMTESEPDQLAIIVTLAH